MAPDKPIEDPERTIPDAGINREFPQKIGNYLIRRLIASGGMGTVYEALQEHPRRPVAIKVMRAGMFSEAGLHRFEFEAQLLARLRHPGVAQIYEAGTHREAGADIPFFAMEYIPNARRITDYATDHGLSTQEKLKLFIHVCDAVHHGHQRGIVHRDLKPGNILVDSAGHPKIIDFGVARATDSDMAAAAHQTEVGQLVGSLQYMSPEQFDADPNDIDTRSDVYALGVVLYELLSGQLPYEIRGTRIHEAASMVRETEPVPLGRIERSLRGDLETIVQCALAKDRDHRYQSAFGLGEDIRRYLSGAAIGARQPTLAYQLRVLVRRNKPWFAAAAIALFCVLGGGALSTYLYFRAESALAEAELHAERSKSAVEFLSDAMYKTWPRGWGHQASIADLVAALSERVDVVFAKEPEIAAQIHSTLGWASIPLEEFEMFEQHCRSALNLRRQALGPLDESTLTSLEDVALAQTIRARYEELLETRREIVDLCAGKFGEDNIETLEARDGLAEAYELLGSYREAREIASDLVDLCQATLGEEHPTTIFGMSHLANIYLKLNNRDQALELAQRAYAIAEAQFGAEDHTTKWARSVLAAALISVARLEEAAILYDQDVPQDPGILKVYQGAPEISLDGPQLLVMWETWCPFSQRVVPIVEELHRRYQEAGLRIAGLTRVNRSSSDERVELYIRDHGLSFPILKDSGKSWSYFGATGTPYVVLLVDGRVVWKGSVGTPADLSERLVRQLMLAAATNP